MICLYICLTNYYGMQFDFDNNKSLINKDKHNIDFHEAQKLWEDPLRIEIPAKYVEEQRILVIANYNNRIWSAVITSRDDKIRIISVRKSRENEKKIYYSQRI